MSRRQRLALTILTSFVLCTLLAGCGGVSSEVPLPAPYSGQGQTSTSTSGGGTPTMNTPCCSPAPTVTPTIQSDPPTADANCSQSWQTGQGLFKDVNVHVPSGCIFVGNSYTGSLGGYTWRNDSPGAVLALPPGTYNGYLQDGAYVITTPEQAPGYFCSDVRFFAANNYPLNHQWPLPTWPAC